MSRLQTVKIKASSIKSLNPKKIKASRIKPKPEAQKNNVKIRLTEKLYDKVLSFVDKFKRFEQKNFFIGRELFEAPTPLQRFLYVGLKNASFEKIYSDDDTYERAYIYLYSDDSSVSTNDLIFNITYNKLNKKTYISFLRGINSKFVSKNVIPGLLFIVLKQLEITKFDLSIKFSDKAIEEIEKTLDIVSNEEYIRSVFKYKLSPFKQYKVSEEKISKVLFNKMKQKKKNIFDYLHKESEQQKQDPKSKDFIVNFIYYTLPYLKFELEKN